MTACHKYSRKAVTVSKWAFPAKEASTKSVHRNGIVVYISHRISNPETSLGKALSEGKKAEIDILRKNVREKKIYMRGTAKQIQLGENIVRNYL